MSTAPLLVIQHEDNCPTGWLGDRWLEVGVGLDLRRPYAGHPLPTDLAEHAGLVVLGGEMGAYDDADHPWLTATKSLIGTAVARGVPTLGVCLGHQLMAVALGGAVAPNPHGHATGLTPIGELIDPSDPLLQGLAGTPAVQWNNDVIVETPAGATTVTRSPDGTPQAVRFAASAWGVQFHPEASPQIFDRWTVDKPTAHLPRADGIDVTSAADEVRAHRVRLRRSADLLADRFAAQIRASSVDRVSPYR